MEKINGKRYSVEDVFPLMAGDFEPGKAEEYISTIKDPKLKSIAQAEYQFYSGNFEEANKITVKYEKDEDFAIRVQAKVLSVFSALPMGNPDKIKEDIKNMAMQVQQNINSDVSDEVKGISLMAYGIVSVLFHNVDFSEAREKLVGMGVNKYIPTIPDAMKHFTAYIMAHSAYLHGEYGKIQGIVDTNVMYMKKSYPIIRIYLGIMKAIALVNEKDLEKAIQVFNETWDIAKADGFIEPFIEHHGLLGGLVERCLRKDYPDEYERIVEGIYPFSRNWMKIHESKNGSKIADNLTSVEFIVAMLANRGWTNNEIADMLDVSVNSVKHHTSSVYQKLGVDSRKALSKYMLR